MKVHLVDGTYELFRAYFGAPPRKNALGREVGAARGWFFSLASLLSDRSVTHIACAYDHVIESFRNQLFVGYKTSYGVPAELLDQFVLAERVSRALGVVTWPMVEFEADDAVATAAERFARDRRVEQVVILSPDKDFAQCVRGTRVVTYDRLRKRAYDEAGVAEKFGLLPESIPDYLALVGDSADGIPGIPAWGAKSAAALLSCYRSIDLIPESARDWPRGVRSAVRLATSLSERKTEALLYRRLATLRLDVPLEERLEDLEWRGPDNAELELVSKELADETVPERAARIARDRSERVPS